MPLFELDIVRKKEGWEESCQSDKTMVIDTSEDQKGMKNNQEKNGGKMTFKKKT